MWNWLSRKRPPLGPTFYQTTVGEFASPSGTLLLADPRGLYDPLRVEGVPPGPFTVHAQMIRYPEGGQRVAKIGLAFGSAGHNSSCQLGTLGVDSAMVVAVDADVYERHWKEVGHERIGHIGIPTHRKVARIIEKEFGLKSRQVNPVVSEFEEPISVELEARIVEYLRTIPEYAEFTFMYFRVKTMNTVDRIGEAMLGQYWAEVVLDEPSGAKVLALSSGLGDGTYPVSGLYCSGDLAGVEIDFIGSAQDEILETFPSLKY